jgi:hypothetical protein
MRVRTKAIEVLLNDLGDAFVIFGNSRHDLFGFGVLQVFGQTVFHNRRGIQVARLRHRSPSPAVVLCPRNCGRIRG